jgi:hypothetical protein
MERFTVTYQHGYPDQYGVGVVIVRDLSASEALEVACKGYAVKMVGDQGSRAHWVSPHYKGELEPALAR